MYDERMAELGRRAAEATAHGDDAEVQRLMAEASELTGAEQARRAKAKYDAMSPEEREAGRREIGKVCTPRGGYRRP